MQDQTSQATSEDNPLNSVVRAQKQGEARGVASVCSANPFVIEADLLHARDTGTPVLIESTCNQVNQYGGYTGQTPADFKQYLKNIADQKPVLVKKLRRELDRWLEKTNDPWDSTKSPSPS